MLGGFAMVARWLGWLGYAIAGGALGVIGAWGTAVAIVSWKGSSSAGVPPRS